MVFGRSNQAHQIEKTKKKAKTEPQKQEKVEGGSEGTRREDEGVQTSKRKHNATQKLKNEWITGEGDQAFKVWYRKQRKAEQRMPRMS